MTFEFYFSSSCNYFSLLLTKKKRHCWICKFLFQFTFNSNLLEEKSIAITANYTSVAATAVLGVSQGSNLGPLLFFVVNKWYRSLKFQINESNILLLKCSYYLWIWISWHAKIKTKRIRNKLCFSSCSRLVYKKKCENF